MEGEHFQKVSCRLLLGVIADWEWMVLQQELCVDAAPWEQEKCKSEHGKGSLFVSLGVLSSMS